MDTMEQEVMTPVQSDLSEALPLEQQLEGMSKAQLIKKADELGYQIDEKLTKPVIIEKILKIDADRKSKAQKRNEESLAITVNKDDPEIEVRFFNLESPNTDVQFAFSGKRGMYGPTFIKDGKKYGNPKGYKKCPTYHLFPGETVKLAYSVYEHLTGLTFVTHKTVFDSVTGMIKGNIPIIKPRFILQPIFTKEQLVKLSE